jgi:hypothetical protein
MIGVFNVASFRPLNNYRTDIQELAEFVKGLPRREGFDELLLPGQRGNREAELRRRTGIPLSGFSVDRTEHYCPSTGRWAPLAGQNLTPLMSITSLISPSLSWVMSTSSWNCRLG